MDLRAVQGTLAQHTRQTEFPSQLDLDTVQHDLEAAQDTLDKQTTNMQPMPGGKPPIHPK
jgi:hypothetical protein